jgi:hypothetical protein
MKHPRARRSALFVGTFLALFALAATASGQVTPPARINYQGVVRSSSGAPLGGLVTMTFRLYSALAGGTLFWQETYDASSYPPQISVSNGLFTVALGDPAHRSGGSEATFANVFVAHQFVFLAVQVAADAEMTPRIQVISAPFAANADSLDGYQTGNSSGQLPVSNGVVCTNLNADYFDGQHGSYYQNAGNLNAGTLADGRLSTNVALLSGTQTFTGSKTFTGGLAWSGTASGSADAVDGYHAGNSSGQIPLNNAAVNSNLSADLLDGQHSSYYLNASNINAGTLGDGYHSSNVALLSGTQTFTGQKSFSNNTYLPGSGIWNSSGNVGIGTTSAGYPLTIQAGQGVAQMISTSSTNGSVLELKSTVASPGYLGAINFNNAVSSYPGQIAYSGSNSMTFRTSGSTAMEIFGDGTVGIGEDPWGSERVRVGGGSMGAYALLAEDYFGVVGYANNAGGRFSCSGGSMYANVGYDVYKIQGTGTVSFIQNHPFEKDRVIVYAAPEGDEVATYTRGTAKLSSGEARVRLGETFRWVTNPDIGLTAHVTPRTKDAVLYVESVSPTELVVRNVTGFPEDATFDYLVYGLRIGFEEHGVVQEKQQEAFIPSFANQRKRYEQFPELRRFDALERFEGMERGLGLRTSFDFSASRALHDAVHEFEPGVDTFPDSRGSSPDPERSRDSRPPVASAPVVARSISSPDNTAVSPAAASIPVDRAIGAGGREVPPGRLVETLAASELGALDPGDVVVADASVSGRVRRCNVASDGAVVGVVQEVATDGEPKVAVVFSGFASCRVDAQYGPIQVGDLLVTSPTPGHAMKATAPRIGAVIGKALEPLEAGTGTIRLLVTLR